MRVVSISVGRPRQIQWQGRTVRTSIWKAPVSGRVHVGRLNLDGDEQSDLTVHGGADKAVYAYPSEHYAWWRDELGAAGLGWGAFGENLTTEGLLEPHVHIGDRYRIGTAELVVTQPRMPCYKLGIRFGRPDMVKLFQQSGRNGFYLAVTREGDVGARDTIEPVATADAALTIAEVAGLYGTHDADQSLLERASAEPALPESWREYFRKRLSAADA